MKQANWRIRGAALAASSGLVTIVLLACSGDDTTTTGADAASTQDSSTIDASSRETSTNEASSGDSASTPDVVVADSPLDSAKGSDGGAEADASLPPIVPLALCGILDTDWGLTPPVTNDDRATGGGWDFSSGTGTIPLTFGEALTSDCEMSGIQTTLDAPGATYGVAEYLNQVAGFTLQFLGCGFPEAGALSFTGLMPATELGAAFVWTKADLDRMAAAYSNAIVEAATFGWTATDFNNGAPPSDVPLTDDQIGAIDAQLAALEAQAIAAPTFTYDSNTTKFTFSQCTVDAGSDAADGN